MRRSVMTMVGLLALVAVPSPAAAVSKAEGGEIELHIEAVGDAQPRSAKIMFDIEATSDTAEGAARGIESAKADLTRKFAGIGIRPEQIQIVDIADPDQDIFGGPAKVTTVSVVAAPPPAPAGAKSKSPPPPVFAPSPAPPKAKEFRKRASVTIALDTLDQVEMVKAKSREFSNNSYRSPTVIYLQRDPVQAQDEAVAKAIAKARAEADRYAAAMGYRVVRIARVSNAKPALNLPDLFGFMMQLDRRVGDNEKVMATTWAGVALDFVIAPK